ARLRRAPAPVARAGGIPRVLPAQGPGRGGGDAPGHDARADQPGRPARAPGPAAHPDARRRRRAGLRLRRALGADGEDRPRRAAGDRARRRSLAPVRAARRLVGRDHVVPRRGRLMDGHGGELAVATLAGWGVGEIFTLSGGHIFSIYGGAVNAGWRIVGARHEQTATFAAEGLAKLTRRPGVAVLTAGPGVTNGVSAITTAHFNGSPLVVLGGRAPHARWGAGSLQELDHVPIVASITKLARTVTAPDDIPKEVGEAVATALTPHRGPVFLDFPLDVVFAHGSADVPAAVTPSAVSPDDHEAANAAA